MRHIDIKEKGRRQIVVQQKQKGEKNKVAFPISLLILHVHIVTIHPFYIRDGVEACSDVCNMKKLWHHRSYQMIFRSCRRLLKRSIFTAFRIEKESRRNIIMEEYKGFLEQAAN